MPLFGENMCKEQMTQLPTCQKRNCEFKLDISVCVFKKGQHHMCDFGTFQIAALSHCLTQPLNTQISKASERLRPPFFPFCPPFCTPDRLWRESINFLHPPRRRKRERGNSIAPSSSCGEIFASISAPMSRGCQSIVAKRGLADLLSRNKGIFVPFFSPFAVSAGGILFAGAIRTIVVPVQFRQKVRLPLCAAASDMVF